MHVQQWRSTLAKYAQPHFGHINVGDIDQAHVLRALSGRTYGPAAAPARNCAGSQLFTAPGGFTCPTMSWARRKCQRLHFVLSTINFGPG